VKGGICITAGSKLFTIGELKSVRIGHGCNTSGT
jgi:hypothetical protein